MLGEVVFPELERGAPSRVPIGCLDPAQLSDGFLLTRSYTRSPLCLSFARVAARTPMKNKKGWVSACSNI